MISYIRKRLTEMLCKSFLLFYIDSNYPRARRVRILVDTNSMNNTKMINPHKIAPTSFHL